MELLFSSIFIFLVVIVGFVLVSLLISKLLQTKGGGTEQKNLVYECGERIASPAWFNFNPRFYVVALIFVIFDVETAFMFPVAVVFRDWADAGLGHFAFVEIGVFVTILLVGLAYVWVKGDLAWVKDVRKGQRDTSDKTELEPEQRSSTPLAS